MRVGIEGFLCCLLFTNRSAELNVYIDHMDVWKLIGQIWWPL